MAISLKVTNGANALPPPLRLTTREAASVLNIHPETLRKLVSTEIFTVLPYRKGQSRGVGKRYFLLTEEVEIYATQGEEALREHRAKKKSQRK